MSELKVYFYQKFIYFLLFIFIKSGDKSSQISNEYAIRFDLTECKCLFISLQTYGCDDIV